MTATVTTTSQPRVWLVAGLDNSPTPRTGPMDRPVVRDHLMRRWEPSADGIYHSADGFHHATWAELHARFDLVEVA